MKSQVVLLSTPGFVPEIHVQLLFRRYFSHRFPIFRLGSPVVSILPWEKVPPQAQRRAEEARRKMEEAIRTSLRPMMVKKGRNYMNNMV